MKTIILCGGGTAGHITPNIALLPELKKKFERIVYLGQPNSMEENLATLNGVEFYPINAVKFDRANLLKNLKIPFTMSKCVKECKKLLNSLSPSVIFSKGGYASLPVTTAARKIGIPYAVHESDYTLGLANKVSARHATLVLTNFQNTYSGKKHYAVGIPLRRELFSNKTKESVLKSLNLPIRKTILVTGGSAGAKSVNDIILQILPTICKKYNVIHLTGKGKGTNISLHGYLQLEFSDDMGSLYKASDIVISRAGATTISELVALNKSAILIPLSNNASRGDQIKNAEQMKNKENFAVLREETLDPSMLIKNIEALLSKKEDKKATFVDNNKKIVDLLYSISK